MPVPYFVGSTWRFAVNLVAAVLILFGNIDIAAAQIVLQDSGPVTATHDGQIIENLRITAVGQHAIEVAGHSNVVIRNVEIFHEGGHGVKCINAPGLTIENVSITHTGTTAGEPWEATEGYNNISCELSHGLTISHTRVIGGSAGIYVLSTNAPHLSFIEGYNQRGPVPRGQLVQFNNSPDCLLEDFSVVNDPNEMWTEDNVNVFNSPRCTVRRGLIEGNNSPSGVGVMFEAGSVDGRVEDVDAIGMGNGAFASWGPDRVQFIRTRWRDNICSDQGRGTPLSNGIGWAVANGAQDIDIYAGEYLRGPGCPYTHWFSGDSNVTTFDIAEVNFAPREPFVNEFPWESSEPPAPNSPPTADYNYSTSNLIAAFTDTSGDVDGSITAWSWNFGDSSSSSAQNPSHSYASAGTYTVTLIVTDDDGDSNSISKSVSVSSPAPPQNDPPVVSFADPVNGQTFPAGTDLTVTVDANDPDGSIANVRLYLNGQFLRQEVAAPYFWQPSQDPALSNMAAGAYTLRAVARDNDGAEAEATITITITDAPPPNTPPTAGFDFDASDLAVTFTDTSGDVDGSITAWSWNFGDGSSSSAQNPSHSYASADTYTVTLTVTDDDGLDVNLI